MAFSKLMAVFSRTGGAVANGTGGEFHSPDRMCFVLRRERMRSDRSGIPFCLLTLNVEGHDDHGLRRLVALIPTCVRMTDEPGWLPDGRVGVVLTDTDAAGAWVVAERICEAYGDSEQRLRCAVYVHEPDSTNPDDDGQRPPDLDDSEPMSRTRATHRLESLFRLELPVWKRSIDLLGAAIGLLISAPILLVAAVAIKLTSRGPVVFTQWRAGAGGRPFRMYKLRTMFENAEARREELRKFSRQDGPAFKMDRDPRVTLVGKLLRVTSIDELPQLWNVLQGEMSLVGPRPLPCDESAGCNSWHRRRLDVTPGLTCIWQATGRSEVRFDDWMRMDLRYASSTSLRQDLWLLFCTVPAVILCRGAR